MQNWDVYLKWNQLLFRETYITSSQEQGLRTNSYEGWYGEQLNIFDNFVIPLATKLAMCNAFGDKSNALLVFANQNRDKWRTDGHEIVKEWMKELLSQDDQNLELKD
jgi:hypothetical protein